MISDNHEANLTRLYNIEWDLESFSNPRENEFDNLEDILERNLHLDEEEESQNDEINPLDEESQELEFFDDGDDEDSRIRMDGNPILSSNEIERIIFPVNPNNSSINSNDSILSFEPSKLFTVTKESSSASILIQNDDPNFLNGKRISGRRPRKDNRDNIYRKIKRGFFNIALIDMLNLELKNAGSKIFFGKFPQNFVIDITKSRNKKILNMTLLQIFKKYELYKFEKGEDFYKYKHNLKMVENEEILGNEGIKRILNKTFKELYTEYVNSDEFINVEIKRLKGNKNDDDYIKRYINLAKNLIKFFSN